MNDMIVTMVAALLSGMLVGRVFARPSRRVASAKSASARHAPFYVGGHGYISIDFCHDGARCDQRQAAKTALKDKVTA